MSEKPEIVLNVDDDAAVRSALKFALEVEGFRVRLYAGSQALLADLDLPYCGCLFVDYRMPVMGGLQLIDVRRDWHVAMSAILITGRGNKELHCLAARSGLSQVLEKPMFDGVLVESIRQSLGGCD